MSYLVIFFAFCLMSVQANDDTCRSDVHAILSLCHLKRLIGTKLRPAHEVDLPRVYHDSQLINSLPETFDSRQRWPSCSSLNEIRDQGSCGSCWAFGAVEAMTDRYCIYSNGTKNFHFSAEDLLTCGPGDCENGGYVDKAWEYWVTEGIVSGGNYDSGEGCRPYTISGHKLVNEKLMRRRSIPTPPCTKSCQPTYGVSYENDKHHGKSSYQVLGMEHMMAELYKNGPFEVAFEVYEDFRLYQNGDIYEHVEGKLLAGHAVKVVGWGVENGKRYWLIANSWGTRWGMEGFFKIRRGNNECGIENTYPSIAGEPILY